MEAIMRSLRATIALIMAVVIIVALSGCKPTENTYEFFSLDTVCSVTVYSTDNVGKIAEDAAIVAQNIIAEDGDNLLMATAEKKSFALSEEASELIRKALSVTVYTDGAFDVTIAPLTALWDINNATAPPSDDEISKVLSLVGTDNLIFDGNTVEFSEAGCGIDIGGVGKGYAGDEVVSALKKFGVGAGIVNLGGNITVFGEKPDKTPFSVAVKNPNGEGYIGVLKCNDCSVVTSGAYERYFEFDGKQYHHILDSKTGYPAESGVVSATVVAKDGVYADSFSTAGYVSADINMLEKAVNDGYITGALLAFSDGRVRVAGDISFTVAGEYYVED